VRRRELRGAAVIGAALVAVALIAISYLRPVPRPPYIAPPPAQIAIQSWHFADSRTGWVAVRRQDIAAGRSALFATRDGGATWVRLSLPVPSAYAVWVRVFDAAHGMVQIARDQADGRGSLLGTDDGGATWQDLHLPDQPAVGNTTFFDRQHGWFLTQSASGSPIGSALSRTSDGGRTWQLLWRMTPEDPTGGRGLPWSGAKGSLSFVTAERGFLEVAGVDGALQLYATQDGGASWAPASLPAQTAPAEGELRAFSNTDLAFASVRLGEPARIQPLGWVYRSTDGGASWQASPLPPPAGRFRVQPAAVLGPMSWWEADGRQLWSTADGGRHWDVRDADLPGRAILGSLQVTGPGQAWSAGWASPEPGAGALLLRTGDGGAHWSAVRLPRLG